MNHQLTFPPVRPGFAPFEAEVEAPTRPKALRALLEHCAAEGVLLQNVVIEDVQDLAGAVLDGLKTYLCTFRDVNLSGASLVGAQIEETTFERVTANDATRFDRAYLDLVRFVDSDLTDMQASEATFSGLRFENTVVKGLTAPQARIYHLTHYRSVLSDWRIPLAHLLHVADLEGIVSTSAMEDNQRAAVRSMSSVDTWSRALPVGRARLAELAGEDVTAAFLGD